MARPSAIRRVIALVTALAVAAPVGALAQAFGSGGCDACPPSCPMHRKRTARCHEGTSTRTERSSPGCKLAQRGCGQHGGERALGLPPAVLPPRQLVLGLAPMAVAMGDVQRLPSRRADPPETPPPVRRHLTAILSADIA